MLFYTHNVCPLAGLVQLISACVYLCKRASAQVMVRMWPICRPITIDTNRCVGISGGSRNLQRGFQPKFSAETYQLVIAIRTVSVQYYNYVIASDVHAALFSVHKAFTQHGNRGNQSGSATAACWATKIKYNTGSCEYSHTVLKYMLAKHYNTTTEDGKPCLYTAKGHDRQTCIAGFYSVSQVHLRIVKEYTVEMYICCPKHFIHSCMSRTYTNTVTITQSLLQRMKLNIQLHSEGIQFSILKKYLTTHLNLRAIVHSYVLYMYTLRQSTWFSKESQHSSAWQQHQ